MDIKCELARRLEAKDDTYNAIGAEIKQHRIDKGKTLSAIADKNCSISYICKVERNQIKPSQKYLRDICKKVGISEEHEAYLLESRELLIEAVKLFYFKSLDKENEILNKLDGLDNHRVELIRLIFAINREDYKEALRCIKKLEKLTGSLATLDLMLFVSFYGIYLYYEGDYISSADYLKLGIMHHLDIDYILPIQLSYLFNDAVITHSPNTSFYYNRLINEALNYGDNLKLDSVHYNMAYYYLLEENYDGFKSILKKIANQKKINTLDYIYNLRLENYKDYQIEELDEIGKCYYKIYNNSDDAKVFINKANIKIENKYYLNYLYLKNHSLDQAYEFLMNVAFPVAINKHLYYDADYYLEEMAMSIHRPNKYKIFLDMYLELKMVKNQVRQI